MNEIHSMIERLEQLETSLMSLLTEARSIKAEIQKCTNGHSALEPLLTVEQVAELLGLETDYVYRQAQAGKIPSKKIGKYRRFQPAKLQIWLEKKIS